MIEISNLIEGDGCSAVEHLLAEIKTGIAQSQSPYIKLEEVVVDIKTIETQMLSPQPKAAVIKAVFASLQQALAAVGLVDVAAKIENAISA